MNYILSVLPVVPVVLLVAAVIYFAIYFAFRAKRERPSVGKMVAEYLLVAWLVMFVYVTQIMAFGNGMGERINLKPLRMFTVAFRYGSTNASGIWQFFLNIVMFIPLGFLLPIVFPKGCRKFSRVLAVSLLTTLATELFQLVTQRGSDIDDVIANTLGGLVGFALFLILYGIIAKVRRCEIEVPNYRRSTVAGVVICCLIGAVYVGVGIMDGTAKYGNLYYGHITPAAIEVTSPVDDASSDRPVYRYEDRTAFDELSQKLCAASGISGEWADDGTAAAPHHSLFSGNDEAIFIDNFNRWGVYYEYGIEATPDGPDVNESAALEIAWSELAKFGISADEVVFAGFRYDFSDDDYHLTFVSSEDADSTRVYGDVSVAVRRDGKVIVVDDERIWCSFVENAKCISPAESLVVAQDIGLSGLAITAVVDDVAPSWQFIPETGYLIPTWKLTGVMKDVRTDAGEPSPWQAEIDATVH